jgi:hypothetical protein
MYLVPNYQVPYRTSLLFKPLSNRVEREESVLILHPTITVDYSECWKECFGELKVFQVPASVLPIDELHNPKLTIFTP